MDPTVAWNKDESNEGRNSYGTMATESSEASSSNDDEDVSLVKKLLVRDHQKRLETIEKRMVSRSKSLWIKLGLGAVIVYVILVSIQSLWQRILFPHRSTVASSDTFDYIIVGGGPSGIVTATKLARGLPDKRVLLVESGSSSQSSVLESLNNAKHDEKLSWIEEDGLHLNRFDIPLMWSADAASQGRTQSSSHHWPIGRTLLARALGGCGLINAMIYIRSLPADYNRWNITGWTWNEISKRYHDLETFVDYRWNQPPLQQSQSQSAWRGTDGPIVTAHAGPFVDAVAPSFIESTQASGWPLAASGFNQPSQRIGAGYYEFNIFNGLRHSVAVAMLGGWNNVEKTKLPSNLVVRTGATVQRVLFDYQNNAIGIEVNHLKRQRKSQVFLRNKKGEVILAAGAIMTPQLLVNSGVGDNGDVAHLPGVGKNVQDHPVLGVAYQLSPELAARASVDGMAFEMDGYLRSVQHSKRWQTTLGRAPTLSEMNATTAGAGLFGTPGFSSGAFLASPWANDSVPDIQLTVFSKIIEPHSVQDTGNSNSTSPPAAMLVTVALLKPEARYQVVPKTYSKEANTRVRKDAAAADDIFAENSFGIPSIELPDGKEEYLSEHDVDRLAWGIEEVRRIFTFAPLSLETREEVYPGSKITGASLRRYVKDNYMDNSHWVGSTTMGDCSSGDSMAVVDSKLKVCGLKNLRIIDAGVIPHVPNGNTHSTVCVVASRGTDFILQDAATE